MRISIRLFVAIALVAMPVSSHGLVNGSVHPLGGFPKFPATTLIKGGCTMVKIAPRTFLTAGHCVFNTDTATDRYAHGDTLEITNIPLPITIPFISPFVPVQVDDILVESHWRGACTSAPCDVRAMMVAGADAALLRVSTDTPLIPIATVDYAPVAHATEIMLNGFGCEDLGRPEVLVPSDSITYPNGRLKFGTTVAEDSSLAITLGYPASAHFFHSQGISLRPGVPSLCQGDSGGPVYRGDKVVGINSAYDAGEIPPLLVSGWLFNWYTRVSGLRNFIMDNVR